MYEGSETERLRQGESVMWGCETQRVDERAEWNSWSKGKEISFGWQVRESSRGLVGYSLCMHSPSVQFLDWSTMPSQSFPPFLGAGALHSLLLQWVHSVPQVDHLLHSVHRPSTTIQQTGQMRVEWMKWQMRRWRQTSAWVGECDWESRRYVGERHTGKGGGTNRVNYANTELDHIFSN